MILGILCLTHIRFAEILACIDWDWCYLTLGYFFTITCWNISSTPFSLSCFSQILTTRIEYYLIFSYRPEMMLCHIVSYPFLCVLLQYFHLFCFFIDFFLFCVHSVIHLMQYLVFFAFLFNFVSIKSTCLPIFATFSSSFDFYYILGIFC